MYSYSMYKNVHAHRKPKRGTFMYNAKKHEKFVMLTKFWKNANNNNNINI